MLEASRAPPADAHISIRERRAIVQGTLIQVGALKTGFTMMVWTPPGFRCGIMCRIS